MSICTCTSLSTIVKYVHVFDICSPLRYMCYKCSNLQLLYYEGTYNTKLPSDYGRNVLVMSMGPPCLDNNQIKPSLGSLYMSIVSF